MGNKMPMPSMFTTQMSVTIDELDLKKLSAKTGFSYGQCEQFYERFSELNAKKDGELTRSHLKQLNGIKSNPLGDRIIEVFMSYAEEKETMGFKRFVETMSKMRTTSGDSKKRRDEQREQKLEFAFRIYDIDNNGFITHNELCEIISKMVGIGTSDEQIEQMADQVIIEMDKDGDHQISFRDYCESLINDDIETKMSLPFLKRRD